MRSGRTVRRGSGDRSWFGRPQAIKKAAGNAASNKGSNASKTLDSLQRHHPVQAVSGAVGVVYELPKKRSGPTRSQYDASSPHRREQDQGDGRNTYGSSPSRQKVPGVRQPRKSRGPTLCLCSTHSPPYRGLTEYSLSTPMPPSVEAPIEKGGCWPPLKVFETWFTASAVFDLIPVLRRFRALGHARNYRFLY